MNQQEQDQSTLLNLAQVMNNDEDIMGSPRSADPLVGMEEEEELDINQITDVKILTSTITKNLHSIKHYEKTNIIGRGIFNAPNRVKIEVIDIMIIKGSITTPMAESIILRLKTHVETNEGSKDFDVKRTMGEIHYLKKIFLRRYPYILIPPLPSSYRLTKQHFLTI